MTTQIAVMLLAIALAADAPSAAADPAVDLVSQSVAVTPDPEHGKILYLKHCLQCTARAHGVTDPEKSLHLRGSGSVI